MVTRPVHRWFHTLVVTGAALTACGGEEQEPVVRVGDAGNSADQAATDAEPDNGIIFIDAPPDATRDAADDYRCCTITK
jgi:hypothetical protein